MAEEPQLQVSDQDVMDNHGAVSMTGVWEAMRKCD
jgi:hypothetical protein